jgi:hypothetical protein
MNVKFLGSYAKNLMHFYIIFILQENELISLIFSLKNWLNYK